MKFIDYYQLLEVPRTADAKEIKQSYRRLAREYHPDLHQGESKKAAEEKFKLINEAYEVLSDPDKRSKYDRLGPNWQSGQDFEPPPGGGDFSFHSFGADDFGFSDFFSAIFGRDFERQTYSSDRFSRQPPEDIEAAIDLAVEELVSGADKDIRLSSPDTCRYCGGSGFSGHHPCAECGGTGVVLEAKTVKVKIPPDLYPGAVLRLKGLGGRGEAGAGDLYLTIRLAPHPLWRQTAQGDLEADLMLFPDQAALGDKIATPTPHGTVQVKIAPGIRGGQKLRLRGKGLRRRDGSTGDLYLAVAITLPSALSSKELELYRQLRAERTHHQ